MPQSTYHSFQNYSELYKNNISNIILILNVRKLHWGYKIFKKKPALEHEKSADITEMLNKNRNVKLLNKNMNLINNFTPISLVLFIII